jgi:hypothetical protein
MTRGPGLLKTVIVCDEDKEYNVNKFVISIQDGEKESLNNNLTFFFKV